ncbi:hypothetical protein MMM5_14540 [Helicobacter pylori]
MLIPFLKISAHYSASDRAGLKRLENSKIKKRKQWGLAKRKRSNPPPKKEFKKRLQKSFKKKSLKKGSSKKEGSKKSSKEKKKIQKKEFKKNPLKKGVPQRAEHQ